jgi:hypothetical protein
VDFIMVFNPWDDTALGLAGRSGWIGSKGLSRISSPCRLDGGCSSVFQHTLISGVLTIGDN